MAGRDRLGIDFYHPAIGADQYGQTHSSFLIAAVRRAIGHRDRTVGVVQQVGGETSLCAPARQIFWRAESNADQRSVPVLEFRGSITEPLGFGRSSAAKSARKKPDQHILSGVIGKADGIPVLIG